MRQLRRELVTELMFVRTLDIHHRGNGSAVVGRDASQCWKERSFGMLVGGVEVYGRELLERSGDARDRAG